MKEKEEIKVFISDAVERFLSKERIPAEKIYQAVDEIQTNSMRGQLGGGVIKKRIARRGQGKSGGYRALFFYRPGSIAFCQIIFAKKDASNISDRHLSDLKSIAKIIMNKTPDELRQIGYKELPRE